MVVRGEDECGKRTGGEGYLILVTLPLSRFCRALPATEAAPFSLRGECTWVLPWWLGGKESACQPKDVGLIPVLGRFPGGGNGNPVQYSWLGKSHGQRNLADCSPWGHKELDTTEQLSMGGLGPELRGGTPAHFYYWCHLREAGTFERRNASLPEGILQIV